MHAAGLGRKLVHEAVGAAEALFTAVVMRHMASNATRFDSHVPTGVTVEERLVGVAAAVLHWGLARRRNEAEEGPSGISEQRRPDGAEARRRRCGPPPA